jgi:CBS domain-containing protein
MRVSQIMIQAVRTVQPDTSIEDARDLMVNDDIRHLPVVDADGGIAGMLSDRDIPRARAAYPPPKLVSEIMTKRVHTIDPEAPAADAAHAMMDFKIDSVPVVKKGKLVGIVTATDFLALACRLLEREQ